MEAGEIIILSRLIQSEIHVSPGSDPLAAIDGAGFERIDDVAAGDGYHSGAHSPQHLCAKLWHTIAQPFEVFGSGHLLVEPAAHLHAGVQSHQRLYIELGVDLVPQCLTTAVVNPRAHLV